jgi:chromosome partitioning protein
MDNNSPKMTAADSAEFLGITIQGIHRFLKLNDLETHKNQNRVYFGFETAKRLFKIKFDNNVVSFQVVKGGTGKTSIAHAFAVRANLYGARVLCIDIDQQGNLTQAFKVNARDVPIMIDILNGQHSIEEATLPISPGLDLLPSRIENAILDKFLMLDKHSLDRVYTDLINKIRNKYDVIVIDCPPALGHSVAAATLASDLVIAPITPDYFSLAGLKITYDEIQNLGAKYGKIIPLKVLINKFDQRNALSSEVLKTIMTHDLYKDNLCTTFIRACQEIQNSIYKGINIFSSLRNTPAKEDIDLLTQEVLKLKDKIEDKEARKLAS